MQHVSDHMRTVIKTLGKMNQAERNAYIESSNLSASEVKILKLTYLKAYTNNSTTDNNWY